MAWHQSSFCIKSSGTKEKHPSNKPLEKTTGATHLQTFDRSQFGIIRAFSPSALVSLALPHISSTPL
jgi:hypothetical protein